MKSRHVPTLFLLIFFLLTAECSVYTANADNLPGALHALSAVLMDGTSGRVLYAKDGEKPLPNASTTKVLTCILALENGNGDDYVPVSSNAASQPEVKLGMHQGEQYYLEDLLYSLMLKSHNDTAVAIAEYIGGTVEGFATMMNQKAKEIGCKDTYFITPNGLDARDDTGIHHTTASDLSLIMKYAIGSKTFLKITQTREYSFSDLSGRRSFTVQNTNRFLDMTDGVLSGKTGFTGDAGYCYVCACQKDDRVFIIALLGCGWPGNKGYKWEDASTLLEYGCKNYYYRNIWQEPVLPLIPVKNGINPGKDPFAETYIKIAASPSGNFRHKQILMRNNESVNRQLFIKKSLNAPIKAGEQVGQISFSLNGNTVLTCPVNAEEDIQRLTYQWCMKYVFYNFFH